jgi:putative RNA 2'-phosphotransferase
LYEPVAHVTLNTVNEQRMVQISKFLSLVLRHKPEVAGLTLGDAGWVRVDDLLKGCAAAGLPISRADLEELVARNSKQRFAFDPAGETIRANQGHSVTVDLDLPASEPPAVLYHGTSERAAAVIDQQGLSRMARHHVHLTADPGQARVVGARHGKPVVYRVDAGAMSAAGHVFYRSANGVWLVESVPPPFLSLWDDKSRLEKRMPSGPERVQAALREAGIEADVLRLSDSTRTAPEAAAAVGCDVGAIAKSLLFMADGEPLLVICGGDRRVDTAKVAALVGAGSVKMSTVDDVRRLTGYAIGGVPPLGHATHLKTLMDNRLLRWPVIYAAAGAHDALFPVDPTLLSEKSGALLADVTGET